MPRIPEAARPLAAVLDELTAPAAPELHRREEGGRVRCLACGHRCLIVPGQRGICQVRVNAGGELRVPFGYVGALQCDPTEKKPFFHVLPGSRALTFGMLGCDLHCGYCFAGDVRVATDKGMRALSELWDSSTPEDSSTGRRRPPNGLRVVVDDGSEQLVRWVFRHDYRGELVRVIPRFLPAFEATPDHAVLATTAPGVEAPRAVPAHSLTTAHYLAVPRRHHFSEAVAYDVEAKLRPRLATVRLGEKIDAERVREVLRLTELGATSAAIGARFGISGSQVRHIRSGVRRRFGTIDAHPETLVVEDGLIRFGQERRPGIPRCIPLTAELAELLGYYCSEGGVTKSKDRPNSRTIQFAFGPSEHPLAERTRELLERLFGVRPFLSRRETTIAVCVTKASLGVFLEELCGAGAPNKHLPPALHRAERAIAEAFLRAYAAGDGHRYAGGKIATTTVSAQLAWDVALLVLRLGHLPAIYVTETDPQRLLLGRRVTVQPWQYSVVWRESPPPGRTYRDDDTFYYVPIRGLLRRPYDGPVYNLESGERHTYLANLFAVNNCQNWLTSQVLRDESALTQPQLTTAAELADLAIQSRAALIASSYNEPLITSEWAAEVMREGRARGLVTAYISNGNATPEVLDFLRPLVDCYKVDLKAMRQENYRQLGAKLDTVLETIRGLKARGFWVEIVTLIVPGLNDSDEELREAARFLRSVDPLLPWHVTAFHPDYRMADRDHTAARRLVGAAEIGLEEDLAYVYCGNLPGQVGRFEDTRCHACGATLVRRFGFQVLEDRVSGNGGRCPNCGTAIPGLWERPAPA